MSARNRKRIKTITGEVDARALAYTAGEDVAMDLCLVESDCIGTAAHVTMLSEMPVRPRLFTSAQRDRLIGELVRIMRAARRGAFRISVKDQDVHMAVERALEERLGEMAKAVHTARSRNDQVAVDLRLYGKEQMLAGMDEALELISALASMAEKHELLPMVGRTHMRPAMPSSVGLWAYAYAEGLLDDMALLRCAYEFNDQCPLGSAAGYGVPLPIDRQKVSDLLGFRRPVHSVLHASNARGKAESVILSSLSQIMMTLSRMANDLIIYSMPEFAYFTLPSAMGTGSSIMPQKNNPDILELVRARASRVTCEALLAMDVVKALPGGYSRDLQEIKEPFFSGFRLTRASLRILEPYMKGIEPNRAALLAGFSPEVFATDLALDLAVNGTPFRKAYLEVKKRLAKGEDIGCADAGESLARRKHMGGSAGLDFAMLAGRIDSERRFVIGEKKRYHQAVTRLLGVAYPFDVREARMKSHERRGN